MTSSIKAQHDALLGEVAARLRHDGYDVVVEPSQSDLPFDLDGYRPDLLARKEQEGLLVEVKSRADRLSVDRLRSAVEEVRRHSGWRFVLITAQDIPGIGPLTEEDNGITWDEVINRVEHARSLCGQGENEAAYIVLWIAFERLLRLQAKRVSLPIERLAPSIVIRQLYSQGELSMEQFDVALACQATRNRVVHGLPSPELAAATDQLDTLVQELLQSWAEPSTAA